MDSHVTGSVVACAPPEDISHGIRAAAAYAAGGPDALARPARLPESTFGNDAELVNELPTNWTLARFQDEAKSALKEYYVAHAVDDAVDIIRDLLKTCPGEADELVVLSIRLALDRDAAAQQAAVELLGKLKDDSVLKASHFVRAFEKLFCTWEDIAIDAPKAPEALVGFLMACFAKGICERSLLTKVPEAMMTAVLASSTSSANLGPEGLDRLRTLSAEQKDFKQHATRALDEYFVALSVPEVKSRLDELGMSSYNHEFVKKAIVASFSQQKVAAARDAILTLLQQLTERGTLTKDDLQWGVTRVLAQLDDLELDCPKVMELAVDFLTAVVADELVSAPFLRRCRLLRIGGATGLKALDSAQRRAPEFFKKHLDTPRFKQEVQAMIQEFFNSGDVAEFGRCVRDMAPLASDRSAELIRKVMSTAMERSGADCEQALRLLVWLCRHEEISAEELENGFDDLYRRMPDLLLDVPDAEEMAKAFVVEAKKSKVLRHAWPDTEEE